MNKNQLVLIVGFANSLH